MELEHRKWMYNRKYPNSRRMREEFVQGVDGFIDYAMSLYPFLSDGVIRCPCAKCKCLNFEKPEDVKLHLYKKGFKDNYYVWTAHEEIDHRVCVNFQNFRNSEAFQKKSTQAKAARASKKGGSLHAEGLVTKRTKRKLAYERPLPYDEVFQETHTKKKDGKKVWVEPHAEQTYNQDGPSKPSEDSFNSQWPRLPCASSSSSQSSVNQDNSDDALEATRRQLEVTQRKLEVTQKLLKVTQKCLQEKTDAYNADRALRAALYKDIELLKYQMNFLVNSVEKKGIRVPPPPQTDFDNSDSKPVKDAAPGDN